MKQSGNDHGTVISAPALMGILQSRQQSEIEAMNYDEHNNQNLDIDPAIILLGIGYFAILLMAIIWTATLVQ